MLRQSDIIPGARIILSQCLVRVIDVAFPRKHKHLLEPNPESVPRPDYVWLAYATCAMESESCGWSGWVVEAAYRRTGARLPTSTGDELLPSPGRDDCPLCGRALFRTGVALRCEPSVDQASPTRRPGVDYEVADIEYE